MYYRKDSRLPEQLQRVMAAEAEAAREARAKIIRSSGEEKAIRTLRQAADELVSPRALQLRYLQVLTHFLGVTTKGDVMTFNKGDTGMSPDQCWTKGRSSMAAVEDLGPMAKVAEV